MALLLLAVLSAPARADVAMAGLRGSAMSMVRQHEIAVTEEYRFLATPADVRAEFEAGLLERAVDDADYALSDVSFPYARHDVLAFVSQLATQYRAATDERLVVTSLTRPTSLQPVNAHALSVHPAGLAVDFRVPAGAKARKWLERALLQFERDGVLDVTREQTPAHYHVAVYPAAYRAYRDRESAPEVLSVAPVAAAVASIAITPVAVATASSTLPEPMFPTGGLSIGLAVAGLLTALAAGTSRGPLQGVRVVECSSRASVFNDSDPLKACSTILTP
jgi:hypothetical protein